MVRRYQDHFGRKAKQEGMPARSVYKLEEIDTRWTLLKPGMRILDLGCAPGSWLLYAARRVGPSGRVLGYDLKSLEIALPANALAHVGDVFETHFEEACFDVVLSDMAPSTMGHHQTDALRSAALVERALDLADKHLKPGGHCVMKFLEGSEMNNLVARMRKTYSKVERLRPQATRKESTEIFLIGLSKKS